MHAKDQAQQHKRQWHSFWQQAMVSPCCICHMTVNSIVNSMSSLQCDAYILNLEDMKWYFMPET